MRISLARCQLYFRFGGGELKKMASLSIMPCPAVDQLKVEGIDVLYEVVGLANRTFRLGERIGEFHPDAIVKMRLSVRKRRSLTPVVAFLNRDKDGNIVKEFLRTTEDDNVATFWWQSRFNAVKGKGVPLQPYNAIQIYTDTKDGAYAFYNVGVFAQDFQTWAWAQKMGTGQLERYGNAITSSIGTDVWFRLIETLDAQGRYNGLQLPTAPKLRHVGPQLPYKALGIAPGTAYVQFFCPFMGFGIAWWRATDTDGENQFLPVKIHHSSIQPNLHGLRMLSGGQIVRGCITKQKYTYGPLKGQERLEMKGVSLVR